MVQIFTDISKTGPKFKFNTGNVVNGLEEYNPILPAVDGELDNDWTLTVWRTPTPYYLNPSKPVINDTKYSDPILGVPRYTWGGQNLGNSNQTRLSVYGSPKNYTYELSVADGDLHDVDLQTFNAKDQGKIYTLDHPLTFSADERVTATNLQGGFGVGYQVGNNFNFNFNIPQSPYYKPSLPTFNMVVQVPIYWTIYPDGNGLSENGTSPKDGGYYTPFSLYYDYSVKQLINDTSTPTLRLSDRSDQLHHISINLNAALNRAVQALASTDPTHAVNYLDPRNWTVGQYYAGTEASPYAGAVLSLDVAHPDYEMDTTKTYDYSKTTPIQTIDNGQYINTVKDVSFYTLPNSANTISLIGTDQTFSSNGNDTIDTSQQKQGLSQIFNSNDNLTVSGEGDANIYAGENPASQLNVFGGKGTQTIFAAQNALNIYANHHETGQQAIIAGSNNNTSFIYGGMTHQTIFTGDSNFSIISTTNPEESNGTQNINVEGGTSSFWGGVEDTTFNITGGKLYADLGSGSANILADMTKNFSAIFKDYTSSKDHLTLTGDPNAISHTNNNTDIYSSSGGHITLEGITANIVDNGNHSFSIQTS